MRVGGVEQQPGSGLRQPHPSASSCGQTTHLGRAEPLGRRALMRSTAPRSAVPRAMSGWFVTTTSRNPAATSAAQAASTPGSELESCDVLGGYGRPSTTRRSVEDAVAVEEDGARSHAHSRPARASLEQSTSSTPAARRATSRVGASPSRRGCASCRGARPARRPSSPGRRRVYSNSTRGRVEADALDGELGDLA